MTLTGWRQTRWPRWSFLAWQFLKINLQNNSVNGSWTMSDSNIYTVHILPSSKNKTPKTHTNDLQKTWKHLVPLFCMISFGQSHSRKHRPWDNVSSQRVHFAGELRLASEIICRKKNEHAHMLLVMCKILQITMGNIHMDIHPWIISIWRISSSQYLCTFFI